MFSFCTVTQLTGDNNYWIKCFPALFTLQIWCYNDQTWTGRVRSLNNNNVWRWWVISLKARRVSRPFSRGVTFTHARVSFALLSLRKNGTSRSVFNKTLCERIFGLCRTTGMILWTCLIAAKELSSYLTREDKSFTPLVCWTTQLIQYVPIHNKNSVISRQCLKICTSSMQTCLEPNYNIGHKWLQPRE